MKRRGLLIVFATFLVMSIGGCGAEQAPAQEAAGGEVDTMGQQYYYWMKAVDRTGNASSQTASVNATPGQVATDNIEDNAVTAAKIESLIRGIDVVASSHMTKGSHITAALAGSESTVYVKDATDFPSSGSGWFIDTLNDRDAFSWTGKTATTLTGCSGVLAHNNGALVIPAVKNIIMAGNVNEIRFFADRGDGTVLELASIGVNQAVGDTIILKLGSLISGNQHSGLEAESYSNVAVKGESSISYGGVFISNSAYGLRCAGATSPLLIIPSGSASAPTHSAIKGSLWVTSAGVLYINTDGSTGWQKVGAQ